MHFVQSMLQKVDQHAAHYIQSNFTFIFPSSVDVNGFTHTAGVKRVESVQLKPDPLIFTSARRYWMKLCRGGI
jgi:hypothetical protein